MTTTLFLRIASIISLLFTLGHTAGGLRKWSPMGDNEVLRAMTAVRFDTMGANRSYFDFFMGFGWAIGCRLAGKFCRLPLRLVPAESCGPSAPGDWLPRESGLMWGDEVLTTLLSKHGGSHGSNLLNEEKAIALDSFCHRK